MARLMSSHGEAPYRLGVLRVGASQRQGSCWQQVSPCFTVRANDLFAVGTP